MKRLNGRLRALLGSAERVELAAGSAGALAVRVGGTAALFLQQLLLARLMGVEAFGDYVYVLSWVSLLSLTATLGLDTTALRYVAEYAALGRWRSVEAFLRRSTLVVAAASLLFTLGTVAAVVATGDRLSRSLTLAFYAAVPLLPALSILLLLSGVLRGLKRTVLSLLPQWLLRPLLVAAATVVAWLAVRGGLGASTVILLDAGLTLALVGWLVAVLVRERTKRRPGAGEAVTGGTREWLRTSLPVSALTAIRMSMNRVDVILLGVFAGTAAAGVYAVAAQMSILITFGQVAVSMIAAPLFAELTVKGDREELQRVVTLGTRGAFAFSLLVGVVLVAAGRFLLRLFGEEFTAGFVPLTILVASQVASSAAGCVGYLLTMTGHERLAAWQTAGAGLLNLALNAWAIPRYGLTGAAIATGLANVLWAGSLAVSVRRRLGLRATAFGV